MPQFGGLKPRDGQNLFREGDHSVERYKERLERQGMQQGEKPYDNYSRMLNPSVQSSPLPATGLASLDFELPTRGLLYRFTVPRGEAQITARAFSGDLLQRLIEIAAVAVVAIVAWFAVRLIRSRSFAWLAKPAGSTLLVCLGLLSLCGGLLPVVGLVAVVAGCGLKVHRRWCA